MAADGATAIARISDQFIPIEPQSFYGRLFGFMQATTAFRVRVRRTAEGGIVRGFDEFRVNLEERMTVLDALFQILHDHDPTLVFRCACRVGMCGTCAVTVNGTPRLACRTRAAALKTGTLCIEPLAHLPVIRDLAVSLHPFFEQWKKTLPGFRPARESVNELHTIRADSKFATLSAGKRDCITCGACFAACGVKATSGEYLGPAALNRALLRILDPRDGAADQRRKIVDQERSGVWRCHTQFHCTEVCPKGISLSDSIARLKRMS